ncbi:hypothetical protein [Lactiplantibacillus mudanjiangensis]|uniref:Uncharacterized protein n=1 Tax=Lactiplantibacillus mudanjiangensis TaxID=1296538 RepID=A0A660E1L9_9LACO|nr:hypothetical protein [Lactiplantibacillus mudanjiangensis]VDG23467.1 hypothetical protein MUDAN_IGPPGNFN_02056 [Lactiplantibacillus mudanjiangensis]VDG29628.1 hypothetical protein MUDAN_MDHGFNIF_03542 [Lactiplantibacillus mudanjiangensis]
MLKSLKRKNLKTAVLIGGAVSSSILLGVIMPNTINGKIDITASAKSINKYNVKRRGIVNNNSYGVGMLSRTTNKSTLGDDVVRTYTTTNHTKSAANVRGISYKTQLFLPNEPAVSFKADGAGKVNSYRANNPTNGGSWIPVSYTYLNGNLYVYYENYTSSMSDGTDYGYLMKYSKNVINYATKNPKFLQLATYWAGRFNSYKNQAGYIKYYNETDAKKQGSSISASTAVQKYADFLKSGDIVSGYTSGNGQLLGHGGSLTNYNGSLYLINDPTHGKNANKYTLERFNTANLTKPAESWNLNFNDPWSGKNAPVDLHNLAFDKKGNFYSVMDYGSKGKNYWSGYGVFKGKLSGSKVTLSTMPLHVRSIGAIQGINYNSTTKSLGIIGNTATMNLRMSKFMSANTATKTRKNQNSYVSNSASISSDFLYTKFTNETRETEGGYSNGSASSYLLIGPAEIVSAKVNTYYVQYVKKSGKAIKNHPMVARQVKPNSKVKISVPKIKGYKYTKNLAKTVTVTKNGKVYSLIYK